MSYNFSLLDNNYTVTGTDLNLTEIVANCHEPNCDWLYLPKLSDLKDPPALLPNPELSGIGVILGFSITAYLTLLLLILHYLTVHNPRRTRIINFLDDAILRIFRSWLVSWKPSRRFEYAMERSVLVLADTQLVSGIAILVAGYSQLHCGVSAYHWQIVVYIAWFASFSFLSSMAFLEDYFHTNDSMRVLRLCFMVVLATLQIVALLPTGSSSFLNLYKENEYFPGLDAACFYKQLTMKTFTPRNGPKLWSMVFSVFVIAATYLSCGFRLYDQGAGTTYKYFRTWPGSKLKAGLRSLEQKALRKGVPARLWHVPYLLCYAFFITCRAASDILGSMLMEIIWLSFAMGWGTIKILTTRSVGQRSFEGHHFTLDHRITGEDHWGYGQILPLVLILLPVLSMAQAYLDNDAKARESEERVEIEERAENARITAEEERRSSKAEAEEIPVVRVTKDAQDIGPDMNESSSSSMNGNACPSRRKSSVFHTATIVTPPKEPLAPTSEFKSVQLPKHPYTDFTSFPWYKDHILLIICQTIMIAVFALWVLTVVASILGIASILRSQLFLIWTLGFIPLASLLHLATWWTAAHVVACFPGLEDWLKGQGKFKAIWSDNGGNKRWWSRWTMGQAVYWALRIFLILSLLTGTLLSSLEAASPYPLFGDD